MTTKDIKGILYGRFVEPAARTKDTAHLCGPRDNTCDPCSLEEEKEIRVIVI